MLFEIDCLWKPVEFVLEPRAYNLVLLWADTDGTWYFLNHRYYWWLLLPVPLL